MLLLIDDEDHVCLPLTPSLDLDEAQSDEFLYGVPKAIERDFQKVTQGLFFGEASSTTPSIKIPKEPKGDFRLYRDIGIKEDIVREPNESSDAADRIGCDGGHNKYPFTFSGE